MSSFQKPKCSICKRPVRRTTGAGQTCDRLTCKRKHATEVKNRDREARIQRQSEIATLERDKQSASCPSARLTDWRPIVTPANTRKLTPLPRRRRYRFMKRLLRLIESDCKEQVDDDQTEVVEPEIELPVLGQACSNCRGSCCQRGGTSAYLDQRVVRRFINANPNLNPMEMLGIYCELIPKKSYEGSCVFHGENGCCLSRDLRSNTCNRTACAGYNEIVNRVELDGEHRFLLVSMDGEKPVASKFVTVESSDR